MRTPAIRISILALWLALPGLAAASDGALEINGACAITGCFALDTPGYPVTINAPGSYRLTSNLAPPATEGAIVVKADGVSIDLGGFDVAGTYVCNALPCAAGNVIGIEGGNRGTRVANGTVRKFSADGLDLGIGARVENLGVFAVGRRAISLGAGSLALGNVVELAGQEGLLLGATSLYRDNTVRNTGARSVEGGRASGPNHCTDGACGSRGVPLFYLTSALVNGDEATTACDAGFHMASFWEIRELGDVEYDPTRGEVSLDGGEGPPAAVIALLTTRALGWVRTGGDNLNVGAGRATCSGWTDGTGAHHGTVVRLAEPWTDPATDASPWVASVFFCNSTLRVWCVQD